MKTRELVLSVCVLFSVVALPFSDSSAAATAEAGKTYTYNFADGSVLPQDTTIQYSSFTTGDGLVTIKSNAGKQFWYHDSTHGGVFYNGNSFEITVAGNATITFTTCTYSADNSVLNFADAQGHSLGSIAADNNGGADAYASSFSYSGAAGVVTATLVSGGSVYFHALTIENAAAIEPSTGKIDVWDFGAEQLDASVYSNHLTVDVINSWYAKSIAVGSSGNVLPSFTAGVLSWVGGSNDRLRTTNTSLTRYDENLGGASGYAGRLYVNSAAATGRYLGLTLSEDDEVTIIALTQSGGGKINFQYVPDPASQTDVVPVGANVMELHFVAKQAGIYHVFDTQDKPSYFRIYRKDAAYATLTGSVDQSAAPGIPAGYGIVFTNAAGKSWTAVVSNGTYSVRLPIGYVYQLSLSNANGYIINSGTSLEVTESSPVYDIALLGVELVTVGGSIRGLDTETAKLQLIYTPDPSANKIFEPKPVVNASAGTYSVQLEPNCQYTISATGVNDYYIPADTITVAADATADIVFAAKPKHHVTFDATGLTAEQLAKLALAFTNLNEEGYVYSFASVDGITLRDGVYAVAASGLDEYPVDLGLTSNLKVQGQDTSKSLAFVPVSNWPFDDKVITTSTPAYKGLLFTGNVYNEVAKRHLAARDGGTIRIPVHAGEKVIVTYYYSADFSIDGGKSITTSSGSTSRLERVEYLYTGAEDGYVTITAGTSTTSYFPNIQVIMPVAYTAYIHVGVDKEYSSVNAALDAIARMDRTSDQRVTVMIDPGNYEEMLVITQPNITLKNASTSPSITLLNQGVDLDPNAVRITSYYGHGYNYYSMGANQKWNADILRVNVENGYLSSDNKGAGTTNGSYWNATVVVDAVGFEAQDIILENSFNQYISLKESEDVVVMWESGNKGERPVDCGNTAVQNRSFVERAAAIAFTGGADRAILNRCRVVGRQDSFYGSSPARVVIYKGAAMGAVDYIFGAMTAVFYQTDLVMNTSDVSGDASYLTAAQQSSGRGFLMYECRVTSTVPGTETASTYLAKPGYFGRPWQATTSEVVFYNTTIETSNYPGYEGKSLISPAGWNDSLGGQSPFMYEYGTIEESGENNLPNRASWATVLTEPTLKDGTAITTFNFTKGSDGWDPLPGLIAGDSQDTDSH
jgi:pectin methylesterase-like acyl-CoA thioesterase